jgi:hypothetical protein
MIEQHEKPRRSVLASEQEVSWRLVSGHSIHVPIGSTRIVDSVCVGCMSLQKTAISIAMGVGFYSSFRR